MHGCSDRRGRVTYAASSPLCLCLCLSVSVPLCEFLSRCLPGFLYTGPIKKKTKTRRHVILLVERERLRVRESERKGGWAGEREAAKCLSNTERTRRKGGGGGGGRAGVFLQGHPPRPPRGIVSG